MPRQGQGRRSFDAPSSPGARSCWRENSARRGKTTRCGEPRRGDGAPLWSATVRRRGWAGTTGAGVVTGERAWDGRDGFEPSPDVLVPELTPRAELALLARALYREGYEEHIAGH